MNVFSKKKKNDPEINNSFRTAFIRCSCDSELLVVRYDIELDCLELSLFENQQSFKSKMSWRQKIRYIAQLLINGQPYTDQIMLDKSQIEELRGFLNSL